MPRIQEGLLNSGMLTRQSAKTIMHLTLPDTGVLTGKGNKQDGIRKPGCLSPLRQIKYTGSRNSSVWLDTGKPDTDNQVSVSPVGRTSHEKFCPADRRCCGSVAARIYVAGTARHCWKEVSIWSCRLTL